jgi:hypothetical protein
MQAEQAVGITLSFICIATFVSALEQLARFRELAVFLAPIDERRDARYELVAKALLIARIVLAAAVIASVLLLDSPVVALTLLALVSSTMRFIWPVGGSGADQLQLITIVSASLCYLLLEPASAAHWAALYIAFQLVLSYVTTGWSKLASPHWRKGDVLSKIFLTYSYGHPQMGAVLAGNARLNQVATWAPMILFSLTPVFVIQPSQGLLIVFLALALAFHIGTGIFMGLNNFVMTFPATYPCVVYAHAYLHSQLQELFR